MISVRRKLMAATTQGYTRVNSVRLTLATATRVATWTTFELLAVRLASNDQGYYRTENLLANIEPLASVSHHIRSAPSTAVSILLEPFQNRL